MASWFWWSSNDNSDKKRSFISTVIYMESVKNALMTPSGITPNNHAYKPWQLKLERERKKQTESNRETLKSGKSSHYVHFLDQGRHCYLG